MGCNASRSSSDAIIENQREDRNRTSIDNFPHRDSLEFRVSHTIPRSSSSQDSHGSRTSQSARGRELQLDRALLPFITSSAMPHISRRFNMPSNTNNDNGNNNNNNNEEDTAVIQQLQSDLATIERLFQTLFLQRNSERLGLIHHHHHNLDFNLPPTPLLNGTSNPPASNTTIESLPVIKINALDMEDENNCSCCICFGDHEIGDEVARLPCGHFFHKSCISQWLKKDCTCPICRWELKTDDPFFEEGRLGRMRERKMRIKSHELERMGAVELKTLVGDRLEYEDDDGCDLEGYGKKLAEDMGRKELVERIEGSNLVDII